MADFYDTAKVDALLADKASAGKVEALAKKMTTQGVYIPNPATRLYHLLIVSTNEYGEASLQVNPTGVKL